MKKNILLFCILSVIGMMVIGIVWFVKQGTDQRPALHCGDSTACTESKYQYLAKTCDEQEESGFCTRDQQCLVHPETNELWCGAGRCGCGVLDARTLREHGWKDKK